MSASLLKEEQLFLGIDGGGSKCKAIVTNADLTILGTGISGPANPLHGFEQTLNSIVHSTQLALEDAGVEQKEISNLYAGVGLAGVNLPVLFNKVANWQHPFGQIFLTTDLHIACLGAHNGSDGAVMISGTGSCGFSWVNGESLTVGGHGFPHGDLGSGAWFGFHAIEQVLLSLDGLISKTNLTEKIMTFLSAKDAVGLVEKVAKQPASYYAKLAGFVFESADEGDVVAKQILTQGAKYISDVARKLSQKNPPRISLIGGLTPLLTPWLDADVVSLLSSPLNPPEMGAVLFAKQQAEKQLKAS